MSDPKAHPIALAKRLQGVSDSATLRLNAAVQALVAQGKDIANFTAGEPDFHVPEAGKAAIRKALDDNKSKYTPVPGIVELRKAIALKTNHQQSRVAAQKPWTEKNVVVSNGGKQAIFNALLALVDSGDEVFIPAPYWLSYPEMAKLAGGISKILSTTQEQGYLLNPENLNKELQKSSRPRILFLNSPSNPTGAMYSESQLSELGSVLKNYPNLVVISDEIYDQINFGQVPFCSFAQACPSLSDRIVTVNGLSKSGAMTGWRVGWSVAQESITAGISTIQGQSTSGINSLAQWAALAVLGLPVENFADSIIQYKKRRDLALEILKKTGKIKVFPPQGAFYIFVEIKQCLRSGEDSFAFAERLLADAQVAVVPGTPFGAPDCVRMSFATDESTIRKGCERIVKYLS